ncbi:MAG: RNA polymerase sigma factor [Planctomycetes bacterium]|nr:RNA polymerase sigma factor [Planctomycetota bacterium]
MDSHEFESDAWATVYRWAYRFLRDHHSALDATQEVMLRWVRLRPSDVDQADVSQADVDQDVAWLRRVTVNHCIDSIRKKKPVSTDALEPVDPNRSPLSEAISSETQRVVTLALEQLTDRQRAVLLAKIYEGDTFAEIAQSMQLALGTVKTHYLRALRTLRDALRSMEKTP